jgi:hypothetical protein
MKTKKKSKEFTNFNKKMEGRRTIGDGLIWKSFIGF